VTCALVRLLLACCWCRPPPAGLPLNNRFLPNRCDCRAAAADRQAAAVATCCRLSNVAALLWPHACWRRTFGTCSTVEPVWHSTTRPCRNMQRMCSLHEHTRIVHPRAFSHAHHARVPLQVLRVHLHAEGARPILADAHDRSMPRHQHLRACEVAQLERQATCHVVVPRWWLHGEPHVQ
jgi:hypothetical protein